MNKQVIDAFHANFPRSYVCVRCGSFTRDRLIFHYIGPWESVFPDLPLYLPVCEKCRPLFDRAREAMMAPGAAAE